MSQSHGLVIDAAPARLSDSGDEVQTAGATLEGIHRVLLPPRWLLCSVSQLRGLDVATIADNCNVRDGRSTDLDTTSCRHIPAPQGCVAAFTGSLQCAPHETRPPLP